jgi:BR serine/threonine kinase
MITVDVNQRITIDEIKAHPAFLYGLPRTYVIPKPIQLMSLHNPMDPSCLTESVLNTLEKIGISHEECKESLAMEGTNQIKEFVDLMLQRTHLDDLPWDSAITELPDRAEISGFGEGLVPTEGLPLTEAAASFSDVPESVASHAVWLPPSPNINFDDSEIFGPSPLPIIDIFTEIQKMLVEHSIPFIYPNDIVIFGKYEDDTYLRMEAESGEMGTIISLETIGQTTMVTSLISERLTEIMSSTPTMF